MGTYLTNELAALQVHIDLLTKMLQTLPEVDFRSIKDCVGYIPGKGLSKMCSILQLDQSKPKRAVAILSPGMGTELFWCCFNSGCNYKFACRATQSLLTCCKNKMELL